MRLRKIVFEEDCFVQQQQMVFREEQGSLAVVSDKEGSRGVAEGYSHYVIYMAVDEGQNQRSCRIEEGHDHCVIYMVVDEGQHQRSCRIEEDGCHVIYQYVIVVDEGQNCWEHVSVANEEQDYDMMYSVEGKDYLVL